MAHEVQSLMYANSIPWHGIGKHVSEDITIAEAIVEAGLDWRVNMVPVYTGREIVGPDGQPLSMTDQVAPAKAIIRADTNQILGVVGDRFRPLQNDEAFSFFDKFLEAGEATLEVAGALRGGRRVFVLAKIKRDPLEIVRDDIVEKYILLAHAHDGTLAVHAGLTPIRVVCMNTLRLALDRDTDSQLIRIRHTARVMENLEAVKEIINAADAAFEATAEQYRFLTNRDVNQSDLERYVRRVFVPGSDEEDADTAKRVAATVIPLFEGGRGNDLLGVRGTWWAAYNAVTEYLSHGRGKSADTRLDQTWFGAGAELNRRALQEALSFAKAA